MLAFGLIFIFSGLLAMGGLFFGGVLANDWILIVFGMIFGGMFILAGYYAGVKPVMDMKYGLKRARKNGRKFTGVIVDYDDDTSMIINGSPLLVVIMKANIEGNDHFIACSTKQVSEAKYPKGAFVDFYLLGSEVYIEPDSVRTTGESTAAYNAFLKLQAAENNNQPIPQYDIYGNPV